MNRYSVPKSNKLNKGSSKSKPHVTVGKVILLTFLSLLFVFLLTVYIFLNIYKPSINNGFDFGNDIPIIEFEDNNAAPNENQAADGGSSQQTVKGNRIEGDSYTFLIVGTDNVGGNTDTMMLVMFNVKESKISILNIPRDTYISINDAKINMPKSDIKDVSVSSYTGRINAYYSHGYIAGWNATQDKGKAAEIGMKYLENVVKSAFGVPVDKYIFIDLAGFKALVDSIGGIDMDVPVRMDYEDPEQNLYIHLAKGFQHLDGNKAEQLVRFRHGYLTQDIGRIETQQKFMAALMKKLLKFDLNNIKSIFDVGTKYMTTDISGGDFAWFAAKILNVKLENVRTHTVPGEGFTTSSGAAVYSAYRKETIEIINKYYNPYINEIPESNFNIKQYSSVYYSAGNIDTDGATMDNLGQ